MVSGIDVLGIRGHRSLASTILQLLRFCAMLNQFYAPGAIILEFPRFPRTVTAISLISSL